MSSRKIKCLKGKRFGMAVAVEVAFIRKRHAYWHCVCECGKRFITLGASLTAKRTKSCGCLNKGERHPCWKGDDVGYQALHNWIEKQLGRPQRCSFCLTEDPNKKYEWANISGKYLRNVNDFMRLCQSCHAKFDKKKVRPKCTLNRAAKEIRDRNEKK